MLRMISLVVMAVRGGVHDDRRPAMRLMPVGMLNVRFGVVIRAARHCRLAGNNHEAGDRIAPAPLSRERVGVKE